MFIGHFGAGLAAKSITKKPSLGTLFFASQFIDLLWPIFLILGLEKVKIDPGNTAFTPFDFVYYPFSHSFLAVLIWSLIFGGIYFFVKKNKTSAVVLGCLVMSHWLLDLLTHRPDLPLTMWGDTKLGLGLWNSVPFTLIIEILFFALGTFLYVKVAKAKNKVGIFSFWILIVFLLIVYFMNAFGPPPPSVEPIGYIGLSQWLIVAWGYWIDKNRLSS